MRAGSGLQAPYFTIRAIRRASFSNIRQYSISEKFLERLPIMDFPAVQKIFCVALRESGMVEQDFGFRALLHEIEPDNRIDARLPIRHAPALDDAFVRHEFEMTTDDASAE